jgi:hypothetical protein
MFLRRLIAGFFCQALLCAAAFAQTTAMQPNPPPRFCINSNCVTTGSSAITNTNAYTGGSIKWNPGHYMASDSILAGSDTLSKFSSEMDDLNGYDNILGYRLFVTWGALETSKGQYNFSVLDSILNRLQTQYNKPKHLVIALMPGAFAGSMGSDDGSTIPLYIQQDSTYGASPSTGSYGWWGPSAGSYAAAIWRPAVMDRLIALIQVLGAHYDGQPNFEGLLFQEDSWIVSAAEGSPAAPDYSDSAMVTQLQRLLTAATAAFPHTTVAVENTWLQNPGPTQSFEQWMVNNRIAPASSDAVGQSAFANYNYGTNGLAWGLQAYMGIQASGSNWSAVDMRSQTHAMMDIEGPDLAGTYFAKWGAAEGFQPLDIIAALNQTYQASHAFWTHYFGSEGVWPGSGTVSGVAPWAQWSNLAPVLNSNPLTSTSYPTNYP